MTAVFESRSKTTSTEDRTSRRPIEAIFRSVEQTAPFDSSRTRTRFCCPDRQKHDRHPPLDVRKILLMAQTIGALHLVSPSSVPMRMRWVFGKRGQCRRTVWLSFVRLFAV